MRKKDGVLWGLVLLAASTVAAAPARRHSQSPLYCAGVVVGMSTETDVRRMYGKGLFVRQEGHGGGRYYVDRARSVTLHVETGVDRVIETLMYSRGVKLPKGATPEQAARAVSPALTARESLWLGIRLGEKRPYVVRQYGKPKRDTRAGNRRVVRYELGHADTPYVLVYEAELRFERDALVAVRLYNGE